MGDFWKKIYHLLSPSEEEKRRGRLLFSEYEKKGYLTLTNRELLDLPLPVIIDFYYRAASLRKITSPVSRRRNSRWMTESDFCFFNIRAAASGRTRGDLIRAAVLLPAMRVNALHLAPFTAQKGSSVNALTSHSHINEDIINRELQEQGISGEEQLAGFIQAAHVMNMKVGLDLPLSLSNHAEVIYHRPDLFRWIKLNPAERFSREQGLPFAQEISRATQEDYAHRISAFVEDKKQQGYPYSEMGRLLEEEGFFPVPVNGERGKGIPFFITYDESTGRPLFTNSSQESELTTFQFHTPPAEEGKECREKVETTGYFSRIFPLWQEKYGFDFVYFDSLAPAYEDNIPLNEAPLVDQIKSFSQSARKIKKYAGVMMTGRSEKLKEYASTGCDLMLERSGGNRQDREYMENLLETASLLEDSDDGNKRNNSILFSLGYHDPGSHTGLQRVRRNHFLARFLGWGNARRGKYEVMGYNDGTGGFISSLKNQRSLEWSENRGDALFYHTLEDIYDREKKNLAKGKLVDYHLDDRIFWWIIQSGKKLLIPAITVENNDMLPPGSIEIDLTPYLSTWNSPMVMEYDFRSPSGNLILFMGGKMPVERIPYRNFRLYTIN